jgi:hypothetical protein
MAERKIVLHRVVGVERAELGRDLLRGGPTRGAAVGQTQVPAYAMDVRIDGNHELGGPHRPQTKIDTVRGADHPARVEEQSFAGASRPRITDQVPHASISRVSSNRVRKKGEALSESPTEGVKGSESGSERSVAPKEGAGSRKHSSEVLPPVDSVNDAAEQKAKRRLVGFAYEGGRIRAELLECELDAPARRDYVPECEARCHESCDFLVLLTRVTMHEADRIAAPGLSRIEVGE